MWCGNWVGTHSQHAPNVQFLAQFNNTLCEMLPTRIWLWSGEQQYRFIVCVVSHHDAWSRPIKFGNHAITQLHKRSASAVIHEGIAVKLNEWNCVGLGNQSFHRSSCRGAGINPAGHHGDQDWLLQFRQFSVEIGGDFVVGHSTRQCRRESNCSAFSAAVSTCVLNASNACGSCFPIAPEIYLAYTPSMMHASFQ